MNILSRKEYSPCYGCSEWKVGCHSTCESYKAYKAVKDQERKDRLLMRRGEPDKIGVSKIKMYNKRVEVGGNE
jgi:hypothetical protein